MRTAILYSGHLRTFDKCLQTQHWHVVRHFPGADFFVSTVQDEDANKAELLRVKYPSAKVVIDAVKEQPDCVADMRAKGVDLPKEWTQGRPYTFEPYAISVHPQAVLRQLWQLRECWRVFTENANPNHYDVIIRCRPDLWFHSMKVPDYGARHHQQAGESFDIPREGPCSRDAYVPYWGQFGGVNDRFAVMGREAAEAYFMCYERAHLLMTQYGCPLHPESLVAAALSTFRMYVRPLFAEFSTLRANGEMRGPEITAVDLARLMDPRWDTDIAR